MNKFILVTGGAGFIGSHLCDQLVESGENVICVDNLLSGSQKNIAHLMGNKKFLFLDQDVCEPNKGHKLNKIDEIYHLASCADPNIKSPVSYMSHPFETMLANTVGTWNMCELAVSRGAKLSFASSSEIYGDPLISPQDENYFGNVSTVGPRSVYDEAKRFGETIVSSFVREKGLDGRITRIFNTYGPRMNLNEGRAVVNFIRQALLNEAITVYGDGLQTRSFCYIDDQVRGQTAAMNKDGTRGEVFNIGNNDERTILDFANIIKKLSDSESGIIFENLPTDDPHRRKPDIKKANKILDWEPEILLEEGLKKTIEYFRSLL